MHTTSIATAIAIERLLDDPPAGLRAEAIEYVELARNNLALDNASITAGIMFAQPLIKMWQPHWKFAYTVGLAVGIKYTTEGFYIGDIVEHLTSEFPLDCLLEGEAIAITVFDWSQMHQRLRNFRNALVNVALDPAGGVAGSAGHPPEAPPNGMHVLIVDDSQLVLDVHRSLIEFLSPEARIHTCLTTADAIAYIHQQNVSGHFIHLILLDLNLSLPDYDPVTGLPPTLAQINAVTNGFTLATHLDAPLAQVPIDFRFKPLVAMISNLGQTLTDASIENGDMQQDGSCRGCDTVIPKPLSLQSMRVLLESCAF